MNDILKNEKIERIRMFVEKVRELSFRFSKNRAAVLGLFIVTIVMLTAIGGTRLAPYDPWAVQKESLVKPCGKYLMGTDDLGRDILSGVLWGAKISIIVGLLCAITATGVGIIIGGIAGYSGGRVDDSLMRVTDFFLVIPQFFLVLVLGALFGNNIRNIILVITVLSWPSTARLVRSRFLSLRGQEFVEAARALGLKNVRIVFGEILPNALSPAIVNGSLLVARAILIEAGLSFLGLGDPNLMSWGTQLFNAQRILRQAWWTAVFPGSAIFVTVLGCNLVGDGLNDALNPKLKEK